jgi:hypothetical protein
VPPVPAPAGLTAEAGVLEPAGLVDDAGVFDPDGDTVEPGVVPEAANATAGATVMITGAVQPALRSVRREITDQDSDVSVVCWQSCCSSLTWVLPS